MEQSANKPSLSVGEQARSAKQRTLIEKLTEEIRGLELELKGEKQMNQTYYW